MYKNKTLISPSSISLSLADKKLFANNPGVIDTKRQVVVSTVNPVVREKRSEINNHFEELRINFVEK